ncbi:hypothetical protein C2845_PM07G23860 [Panicum miliaceum]|uniref:Uncharacterized protein n=1 Tax=Panicum miliaceum TaxID=4540 RepID=A0A3L6SI80_PANMI|nr:hypothetical protein C2845_PM07G23860 [Panicum miliaceum]
MENRSPTLSSHGRAPAGAAHPALTGGPVQVAPTVPPLASPTEHAADRKLEWCQPASSSAPPPAGRALDLRLRRRLHGGHGRGARDEVLRAAPGDEVDELLAGLVGARGRGRDPEQHGDGHEEEPRGDEQRPEEGQHGAEPRPERGDRDGGRGHDRHQGRGLEPVLPH